MADFAKEHMSIFQVLRIASGNEFIIRANRAAAREQATPDAPDAARCRSYNLVVMVERQMGSSG